jgi:hypothetical protein
LVPPMSGAAKINEELIMWIDMTGVTFSLKSNIY